MYSLVWRNKYLTVDARTIHDIVTSLRAAADELEGMEKAGVTLSGGAEDDYAMLVTDDAETARRFGFGDEDEDEYEGGDGEDDAGMAHWAHWRHR